MIDKNDIYWNEMKNTNYLTKKFLEMCEDFEKNVTDYFECTKSSYNQCLQQLKNNVQSDALEVYVNEVIIDISYFLSQLDNMAKYDSIVDVSDLIVKVETAYKVLEDAEEVLYQETNNATDELNRPEIFEYETTFNCGRVQITYTYRDDGDGNNPEYLVNDGFTGLIPQENWVPHYQGSLDNDYDQNEACYDKIVDHVENIPELADYIVNHDGEVIEVDDVEDDD